MRGYASNNYNVENYHGGSTDNMTCTNPQRNIDRSSHNPNGNLLRAENTWNATDFDNEPQSRHKDGRQETNGSTNNNSNRRKPHRARGSRGRGSRARSRQSKTLAPSPDADVMVEKTSDQVSRIEILPKIVVPHSLPILDCPRSDLTSPPHFGNSNAITNDRRASPLASNICEARGRVGPPETTVIAYQNGHDFHNDRSYQNRNPNRTVYSNHHQQHHHHHGPVDMNDNLPPLRHPNNAIQNENRNPHFMLPPKPTPMNGILYNSHANREEIENSVAHYHTHPQHQHQHQQQVFHHRAGPAENNVDLTVMMNGLMRDRCESPPNYNYTSEFALPKFNNHDNANFTSKTQHPPYTLYRSQANDPLARSSSPPNIAHPSIAPFHSSASSLKVFRSVSSGSNSSSSDDSDSTLPTSSPQDNINDHLIQLLPNYDHFNHARIRKQQKMPEGSLFDISPKAFLMGKPIFRF